MPLVSGFLCLICGMVQSTAWHGIFRFPSHLPIVFLCLVFRSESPGAALPPSGDLTCLLIKRFPSLMEVFRPCSAQDAWFAGITRGRGGLSGGAEGGACPGGCGAQPPRPGSMAPAEGGCRRVFGAMHLAWRLARGTAEMSEKTLTE